MNAQLLLNVITAVGSIENPSLNTLCRPVWRALMFNSVSWVALAGSQIAIFTKQLQRKNIYCGDVMLEAVT